MRDIKLKVNGYTLTDTFMISCHGTSFKTLAAARNYAYHLRTYGLCKEFAVGAYIDGEHKIVYRSNEDVSQKPKIY